MKRSGIALILCAVIALTAFAESRVSVSAELFNSVRSGAELESWTYLLGGAAELSVMNRGSRLVRSELLLRFVPAGRSLATELQRFYTRATFGEVLATIGKTRSSWGSGIALNAGDIIFGSSSVDFSLLEADPRSQTAWLTSVEIPIGVFSFAELIALPGEIDASDPLAPTVPGLADSSVGGRVSLAAGNATVQAGYLYRGHRIAGLGDTGHHAFLSTEGYLPFNWHVSASARTPANELQSDAIEQSLTITAGAFDDISLVADRTITWQLETVIRPYGAFEASGDGSYGVYLYPAVGLAPRTGLNLTISSLVSPIDVSANTAFSGSWNIYESLTLLASVSVRSGESGDTFSLADAGGVSLTVGTRYVY